MKVEELGDTYYINTETGETSTEVPDDYEEDEEEDVSVRLTCPARAPALQAITP